MKKNKNFSLTFKSISAIVALCFIVVCTDITETFAAPNCIQKPLVSSLDVKTSKSHQAKQQAPAHKPSAERMPQGKNKTFLGSVRNYIFLALIFFILLIQSCAPKFEPVDISDTPRPPGIKRTIEKPKPPLQVPSEKVQTVKPIMAFYSGHAVEDDFNLYISEAEALIKSGKKIIVFMEEGAPGLSAMGDNAENQKNLDLYNEQIASLYGYIGQGYVPDPLVGTPKGEFLDFLANNKIKVVVEKPVLSSVISWNKGMKEAQESSRLFEQGEYDAYVKMARLAYEDLSGSIKQRNIDRAAQLKKFSSQYPGYVIFSTCGILHSTELSGNKQAGIRLLKDLKSSTSVQEKILFSYVSDTPIENKDELIELSYLSVFLQRLFSYEYPGDINIPRIKSDEVVLKLASDPDIDKGLRDLSQRLSKAAYNNLDVVREWLEEHSITIKPAMPNKQSNIYYPQTDSRL